MCPQFMFEAKMRTKYYCFSSTNIFYNSIGELWNYKLNGGVNEPLVVHIEFYQHRDSLVCLWTHISNTHCHIAKIKYIFNMNLLSLYLTQMRHICYYLETQFCDINTTFGQFSHCGLTVHSDNHIHAFTIPDSYYRSASHLNPRQTKINLHLYHTRLKVTSMHN